MRSEICWSVRPSLRRASISSENIPTIAGTGKDSAGRFGGVAKGLLPEDLREGVVWGLTGQGKRSSVVGRCFDSQLCGHAVEWIR